MKQKLSQGRTSTYFSVYLSWTVETVEMVFTQGFCLHFSKCIRKWLWLSLFSIRVTLTVVLNLSHMWRQWIYIIATAFPYFAPVFLCDVTSLEEKESNFVTQSHHKKMEECPSWYAVVVFCDMMMANGNLLCWYYHDGLKTLHLIHCLLYVAAAVYRDTEKSTQFRWNNTG